MPIIWYEVFLFLKTCSDIEYCITVFQIVKCRRIKATYSLRKVLAKRSGSEFLIQSDGLKAIFDVNESSQLNCAQIEALISDRKASIGGKKTLSPNANLEHRNSITKPKKPADVPKTASKSEQVVKASKKNTKELENGTLQNRSNVCKLDFVTKSSAITPTDIKTKHEGLIA